MGRFTGDIQIFDKFFDFIKKENNFISVEDYLQSELEREIKHELINGNVFAMAGASKNHDRLSGNIYGEFRNHLKEVEKSVNETV